jgi:hypothetical protein
MSDYNILIDPDTGALTGIIDGRWPAWLGAVAARWFNDDLERFLMTDNQSVHVDEMPTDALVRAHFHLKLAELDRERFRHHLQGIELRALFYACCNGYAGNTEIWLERYKDREWPTGWRDPFSFDYMAWIRERLALEERSVSN